MYKCLANAKRPCDCSVMCLPPKSSLCSCQHYILDLTGRFRRILRKGTIPSNLLRLETLEILFVPLRHHAIYAYLLNYVNVYFSDGTLQVYQISHFTHQKTRARHIKCANSIRGGSHVRLNFIVSLVAVCANIYGPLGTGIVVLQLYCWKFSHKKLCSRLYSTKVDFYFF